MTNETTPAPAPAADAATGERYYTRLPADDEDQTFAYLEGPDGFECVLGEPEDRYWFRDGAPVVDELNRLAAERDRLALEVAALAAENAALREGRASRTLAIGMESGRAEAAEAERDRLALEVAAMRGAMRRVAWFLRETDPHWVRVDTDDGTEIATLLGLAITLEAAALSVAPTPPAAEAVTGGGRERHRDALNALCSLGVAAGDNATFRRAAAAGLSAWAVGRDARAAIDAALDQEADHAQ